MTSQQSSSTIKLNRMSLFQFTKHNPIFRTAAIWRSYRHLITRSICSRVTSQVHLIRQMTKPYGV